MEGKKVFKLFYGGGALCHYNNRESLILQLMTFGGCTNPIFNEYITVSEVGLELPSSLKFGFLWALHLQSTV